MLRLADQDVEEAPVRSEFTVVDPTGSLATVSVASVVSCSCGEGGDACASGPKTGAPAEREGPSPCTHRQFVMHRVFCLPPASPLAQQDALVARERRVMDEHRPGLSRVMLAQPRMMRTVAALAGRSPLYQRPCELADTPSTISAGAPARITPWQATSPSPHALRAQLLPASRWSSSLRAPSASRVWTSTRSRSRGAGTDAGPVALPRCPAALGPMPLTGDARPHLRRRPHRLL